MERPCWCHAEGAGERDLLSGGLTREKLQLFLNCAKCCISASSVNTLGFVNAFLFLCHVLSWVFLSRCWGLPRLSWLLWCSGLCLSLHVGKSGAVHGLVLKISFFSLLLPIRFVRESTRSWTWEAAPLKLFDTSWRVSRETFVRVSRRYQGQLGHCFAGWAFTCNSPWLPEHLQAAAEQCSEILAGLESPWLVVCFALPPS